MTLISRGYSNTSDTEDIDKDWQLFSQNIDLLLQHEQNILSCGDYFFCSPAFSCCSWPYVQGDGQLFLGYLLIGLQTGVLVEQCSDCKGKVLITSFAGSPLTGGNTWTGICLNCRQQQRGKESKNFRQWMDFVLTLRKTYPAAIEQHEEYLGQKFIRGGAGLTPTIKQRKTWVPIAEPVTLSTLIEEIKAGKIRIGKPINVCLLKEDLKLKPFSRY